MRPLTAPTLDALRNALNARAATPGEDCGLIAAMHLVRAETGRSDISAAGLMAQMQSLIASVPAVRAAPDSRARDALVQRLAEACLASYYHPHSDRPA